MTQRLRRSFFIAALVTAVVAVSCGGGGSEPGSVKYDEESVIAVVQGWPLLHPNDYVCGTATVPERTILAVVARVERLDFDFGCGPDDDGSAARRAVRLVLTDTSWAADEESNGVWSVTLDPGTGRTYEWVFLEDGPQLLARGGDALLWPLFNWSNPSEP